MRKGVVDHQMVEVIVRDAGLGKGRGAGDTKRARGGEILHLADHRGLDALAGADRVAQPLSVVRGKLFGKSRGRHVHIGRFLDAMC
jgi:hypothetical protein